MAIATGTALLIGAGISAAASAYGAKKQSDANKDATRAASAGNTAALDYTKQQEATRRADYDKATELWKAQWNAWNGQRMAYLQRLGVDVSGMQAPPMQSPTAAPSLMGGGRVDPRTANAIGAAAQGGQTVADILGRGAEPSNWNDWKQYGLPA